MSPNLILGPLLRYAGARDATVWVETNASCEVEVLVGGSSHCSRTFSVEGHHYALVRITGLKPGSSHEYAVTLDGERVWPEEGDPAGPGWVSESGRPSPVSPVSRSQLFSGT
jgi:hypothetical protein